MLLCCILSTVFIILHLVLLESKMWCNDFSLMIKYKYFHFYRCKYSRGDLFYEALYMFLHYKLITYLFMIEYHKSTDPKLVLYTLILMM